MREETFGSAHLAGPCPATTEGLLWMWTGSLRVCLLLIHTLLHFILIPFSPMFSICLLSFPFCSSILILKITLRFLIYFLFLSTLLHLSLIYFLVSFPAIILAFVYFPLLFILPVFDPLPSSPTSLLV